MTFDFNQMLNWKLLAGSHNFPGSDGGTCINEAAIIAAGFEYKSVKSPKDCPPCFSRTIANYAIILNDKMPDDLRQRLLLPFVMRLAGSADTEEIEQKRQELIIIGLISKVISIPLRKIKHPLARQFEAVGTMREAKEAVIALDCALTLDLALDCALAIAIAFALTLDLDLDLALALTRARALTRALAHAYAHARALAHAHALQIQIFESATELLDQALKIGKQAEPMEISCVKARMDQAKETSIA